MSKDSKTYVKQCSNCNMNKKGNRIPRSALESYHAECPMERVQLDILGPINPRSKSGSVYKLVMVDQFTKWVVLAALPTQNAELTAVRRAVVRLKYVQIKEQISKVSCSRHSTRFWKCQKTELHIIPPVMTRLKFSTVSLCK